MGRHVLPSSASGGIPSLVGDAVVEKGFTLSFAGTANEKADLYFPAGTAWSGVMEVQLAGIAGTGGTAIGLLAARYTFEATSTGTFSGGLIQGILATQGNTSVRYALGQIGWDATNSRLRITIHHRTASVNTVGVAVRFLCPSATHAATARAVQMGAIYTTDASVHAGNNMETISNTLAGRVAGGIVITEATARWYVQADGKTFWGDGTAAVDTNLYRSAADTLKTDDSLHVGAGLRHLGSTLGFYNAAAASKPTVTGSRADGTALTSLLTALATLGLITDSSAA